MEKLAQTHDESAVPALTDALKDEDSLVQRAAAKALGEIGDAQAVPGLVQALLGQDEWVAIDAAIALGKIGSVDAIPALLQALRSEEMCEAFDRALEQQRQDGQADPGWGVAFAQFADDISQLRASAAYSLGQIKDPGATPGLIDALYDTHITSVSKTAAWALEQIGTPEALAAVKEWQQQYDEIEQEFPWFRDYH